MSYMHLRSKFKIFRIGDMVLTLGFQDSVCIIQIYLHLIFELFLDPDVCATSYVHANLDLQH